MTIRRLLLLSVGIVLGAYSLFVYAAFPARFETRALALLEEEAGLRASVAAYSLRSGLVFEDDATLEEILQGLYQDPGLVHVEVLDALGNQVTVRTRPSPSVGTVVGEARVLSADQIVGAVRLTLSTERVTSRVAELRATVGWITMLMALVGLATTMGISVLVAGPLDRVATAANLIAEGDAWDRAPDLGPVEVRRLSTAFNAMVDRLQLAHREADEARGRLQEILESLPGIVEVFDATGERALAPSEGVHTLQARRVPREVARAVYDTVRRGVVSEAECIILDEESEARWFHFAVSPIPTLDGAVSGAVAYGTDVTALRKTEAALAESEMQLRKAQKMEALGRLAGGVAHDFNNALTAIQGHAELAREDADDKDDVRDSLDHILDGTRRASNITRRLLAFGRRQVLQPEQVDLRETTGGLVRLAEPMLGDNVRIDLDLGDEQHMAEVDPGQLEQALLNLCINARDAMQPNGGTLRLGIESVWISELEADASPIMQAGAWTVIVVGDDGCGMDPHTQAHVFEPFFSTKGPAQGSGLGLAMVHGFVTQSGGFVTFSSDDGQGTEFRIHLPPMAQSVDQPELGDGMDSVSILMVDDEPTVLSIAARILRQAGCEVFAVNNAREALEVTRSDARIDLLLTDFLMPDVTGDRLARQVLEIRPDLPVLFMSGHLGDGAALREIPEFPLVEKPFSRSDLIHGVRTALVESTAG